MSNYIDKLRNIPSRQKVGRKDGSSQRERKPLDSKLTFIPFPEQRWTFEEGSRICLNDLDVREIIRDERESVSVLSGLSQGLHHYQQYVWSINGKGYARFNGAIASLQGTILGRLVGMYEGLTDGVHVECQGDDFWINDINLRSLLKLYWRRPTEKARRYLMGLRDKLALILSRQRTSNRYDGIHHQACKLFNEISLAVEHLPPDAPYRLVSGERSA